jgi:hypothetical protein
MGWLSRLITAFMGGDRAIAHRADLDFGEMWRNTHGTWRAHLSFVPTGEKVSLYFYEGKDDGPTEWQRRQFHELVVRYSNLRQEMSEPLRREYEEIRTSWELSSAEIKEPTEIWNIAHLIAIEISKEGTEIDISLNHLIDWENEDHDLNVRLKDWRVLEVAMEG